MELNKSGRSLTRKQSLQLRKRILAYGKDTLSKVTVQIIPDAEASVLSLQPGDVDAISEYYHGGSAYAPRNMLTTLEGRTYSERIKGGDYDLKIYYIGGSGSFTSPEIVSLCYNRHGFQQNRYIKDIEFISS